MLKTQALPGRARRQQGAMAGAWWRIWWPWLGALTFASILAALPNDLYRDRDNYIDYLQYAPVYLLTWLDRDFVSILANEPLFLLLNAATNLLLPAEQALQLLIFVPAAIVAHKVLRASPEDAIYLILALLVPQVLLKHVVHLRQGLAISIFLVAWLSRSRWQRRLLIALTPFIHASFFFVLLLVILSSAVRRLRLPPWAILAAFALAGVGIGLSLDVLAKASGARQGDEYEFAAAQGISGAGFVLWCWMLGLFLTQSRHFFHEHIMEIGSVAFYLSTYFLSPVTARVFESTLLLVLLSNLKMRGIGRTVFATSVVTFSVLQWLMLYMGGSAIFTVTGI